MPTKRLPLVGVPNTRNVDPINVFTKDQIYKSVLFDVVSNPQTGNKVVYASKRPGFQTGSTVESSSQCSGRECEDNDGFNGLAGPCTAFVNSFIPTSIDVYVSTDKVLASLSIGLATSDICITKAIINGEENYLIAAGGTAGMYYVGETGMAGGVTFTGDTVNGNATVSNVSSFTGLVVGQKLSGTGIAASQRIQSLNSGAGTLVMTANATATNTGVTITRERGSKVIDADAPTAVVGPMIEMDGYVFVAERDSRKVYQSDINSIASWTATSFITANITVGYLKGIARLKNNIIGVKTGGLEFFYNAGNASGSVLSPMKDSAKRFGVSATPVGLFDGSQQQYSFIDDFLFIVYDGVYMLSPNGIQDISDPVLQNLIANSAKTSVMCRAFKMLGKYYVYVSLGTTWQFIYDVKDGIWAQAGFTSQAIISKTLGYAIYTATGDGELHYYPWTGTGQTPVYQDDGASYTMTIQMASNDYGTPKRKFVSEVALIGDVCTVNALSLPGSASNYASTPDSAALDITGDIDIRAYLAPADWTPTDNPRIAYKRNLGASYDFYIVQTSGNLGFFDGTTTYVSTVAVGFTDGALRGVRINRVASTGVVTFFTTEDYVTWTQLGATVAGASGNLPVTTSALWIGTDGTSHFNGKIYRVDVRNGIDGTVVAGFNASFAEPGATTLLGTAGETWTVNTSGSPAASIAIDTLGVSGSTVGLVATLETNDKDFASDGWVTRGTFDLSKNRQRITRVGSHEAGRSYRLTNAANRAWRGQAIDVTYTEASR